MSVALVNTGVQFPDSTIQTTAATPLSTITYENRGNLRTTTPAANLTSIAVEDLGLFVYYANNTEPDDDDTCFIVAGSGGAWRLLSPSMEFIENWQLPEWELLLNRSAYGYVSGYTCFYQTVSAMGSGTTTIMAACIPGAKPGDLVVANPINYSADLTCAIHSYTTTIPCNNCVWLYLTSHYYKNFTCTMLCGQQISDNISTTPYCGCNTLWKAISIRTDF